jgi:leader peptidase (prepilin peptidase)/N-methyltransferase
MNIVYTITIFTILLGPALGSFFAALVMREEGLTKSKGRFSVDDFSNAQLKWFELIPIFSFMFLRGRSRYTGDKLDIRMFLAEVLGLLVFGILAFGSFASYMENSLSSFEFLFQYLVFLVITVAMFFLAVYDLFTYSIPSVITLYTTLAAVGANILIGSLRFLDRDFLSTVRLGNVENLLAGLVAASFIWLLIKITKQKGMGDGDVYIAIIMGVMLGWVGLVASFYVTVFSATAIGLVFMARKRQFKGLIIPLVPFMTLGFVFGAVYGHDLVGILFFGI